jgi:aryl-phospho-beta-D-glucosidase BglC (GH1 family)
VAYQRRLAPALAAALAASFAGLLAPTHSVSAAAVAGPLSVSGSQVVDASGAPVRLQGITRSGYDTGDWPPLVSQSEVQQMASWNANVVRIPLAMDFWNADCPTRSYNGAYRGDVDSAVQLVTGQGMLAVLDLKASTRFQCDTQGAYALPGATEAKTFWTSVAARYAGNPLVGFELFDSPDVCATATPSVGVNQSSGLCASPRNVPADETLWRDGGSVLDGFPNATALAAAGMATMYADVTAALPAGAPSHLVLVDGNGLGTDPHSFDTAGGGYSMFHGGNLVYGQHVMPCTAIWTECPTHDSYYSCATVAAELDGFQTADVRVHPSLVDEFGWPDRSWGALDQHVVDHLHDSSALSFGRGFIAYAWDGLSLSPFDIQLSGTAGSGDATPSGLPVKNAMSGVYGNTCPGPAPAYPQALVGPFTVSGNQILDGNKQAVVLKGVNWEGMENSNYRSAPPEESAVDHLAQWKGNFLRLELSDDAWNQDCPAQTYDPNYRPLVDRVVNWAAARGMLVLLDLHVGARVQCDMSIGPAALPGAAEAQSFWASVAARYAANPLVAYELYNEPHVCASSADASVGINEFIRDTGNRGSVACKTATPSAADEMLWENGGTVEDGLAYPAAGMAQLYRTIMASIPAGSPPHLVFVDSNNYSSENQSFAPTLGSYSMFSGGNLVYVEHVYTCSGTPPDSACTSLPGNSACSTVAADIDGYNAATWMGQHPVVADEFGWPDSTEGTYNQNVVSHLAARGMGFAVYSWAGNAWQGQEGGSGFLAIADNIPGSNDATVSGRPVKDAMSGVYPVSC